MNRAALNATQAGLKHIDELWARTLVKKLAIIEAT